MKKLNMEEWYKRYEKEVIDRFRIKDREKEIEDEINTLLTKIEELKEEKNGLEHPYYIILETQNELQNYVMEKNNLTVREGDSSDE